MTGLAPEHIATYDRVRHELAEILSQPEYNRSYGPDPVEQAWRRLLDVIEALADRIGRLFGFRMEGAGRVFSIIFACLVILAFVAVLALVISKLRRGAATWEEADKPDTGRHRRLPSAEPLIKQAERLAAQGDYRGAFGSAYLAAISRLDEAGALRFEPSRTNWEYLRELAERGRAGLVEILRPLSLDFDRKIYGREPCVVDDYRNALAVYQAVSAEVAG